jgi:hypothetical protein
LVLPMLYRPTLRKTFPVEVPGGATGHLLEMRPFHIFLFQSINKWGWE